MSFDVLYNNFKIVEQEVKRTVTSSSNSGSQNMAFVSTPSISTDSTLDSTANLSDATVYAFLANQPNGSQLVHEDLEQIYEDDLEEMDLKWQLTLLSMRARRECKNPRNQESKPMNQDSSRRTVNVEDTSSKAMVAIDGVGFDWSYMADEEVPTNMTLMAFSDSEVNNDKTCSNTCLKSFEALKTHLDNLRVEFNKSEFNLATYKRGLASIEEQLVFYKKNEVMFCDQIAVLKRDASFKDSEINALNIQIEKLNKEKESNQIKIDKFENASKSLDKLIGSQISDNNRKGYGFKANKGVYKKSSNEIKKTTDTPIIEDWVSDYDEDDSEVMNEIKTQKLGVGFQTTKKACFVCRSFNHLIKDCDFHDKKMVQKLVLNNVKKGTGQREVRPVWNNAMRVNHQNFSNSRRNFVPTAVLTKSGIVPVSAARPINTAAPKSFVNAAKTRPNAFQKVTSAVGEQGINAVKSSACWVWRPKIKTATVETVNDGEQQITVIVDEKTIAITKASVRRHSICRCDTPGSDEGSKKLNELTELCIKLSDKVEQLGGKISNRLRRLYCNAITKLGRMIETKYEDVDVEIEYEEVEYELDQTDILQQINPTKVSQGEEQSQEGSEVQLDVLSAAKILADASRERVKTYKRYTRKRRSIVTLLRDSTGEAVHAKLQAYRAHVNIHEIQIQTWDTQIGSLKTLVATLVGQTLSLQTPLTTTLGRIQTLEAREPSHTTDLEDTGSSS
ncbi:hypothetical protein Tco_0709737 [Tanacetum coccineum]